MDCDPRNSPDVIDAEAQVLLRRHYAPEIAEIRRRHTRRRSCRRGGMVLATGLAIMAAAFVSTATRAVAPAGMGPGIHEMADGTRIYLDAGAALEIPLAPWRRDVRLTRGDALFEVVHHESRPFTVQAGKTVIRDLGTRFLVRSTSSMVSVAVFEGAAELSDGNGNVLSLGAGHAARAEAGHVAAILMPDETEATAWRQGRMVFRDAPLTEVAERLSRYGGVPVVLSGADLAGLRVSGVFSITDIPGALTTLQRALPVRIVNDDAGIVISRIRIPAR